MTTLAEFFQQERPSGSFRTGYLHGLMNRTPDNTTTNDPLEYYRGYSYGTVEREAYPVQKLDGMTDKQYEAVILKYCQNPDGARSVREFFARVRSYSDGYVGLNWCGMFVGIERDGYSHT